MQFRKFNKYVARIVAIPLIAGYALLLSSDAPKSPICREGYVFQSSELGEERFGIRHNKGYYDFYILGPQKKVSGYLEGIGNYEFEVPSTENIEAHSSIPSVIRLTCD